MQIQLDLFDPEPSELSLMRLELRALEESMGAVRRGLFARHGELGKAYLECKRECEEMREEVSRLRMVVEELTDLIGDAHCESRLQSL